MRKREKWRVPERTVIRLRDEKGLSMKELAKLSVSENTIRKLWGVGASRESLDKIAKALGVNPDDIAVAVTDSVDVTSFYPAVGLRAAPPVNLPDDGCYQDWSEDGYDQVIEYLWAEAKGSSIKAEILPKKDKRQDRETVFLRISFENAEKTFPSNVAIHPKGMRAVAAADKRYLVFRARLPPIDKESGDSDKRSTLPPVGIAVRVRDARLQQWEYRKKAHEDYLLEDVTQEKGEGWQDFAVDLKPSSEIWQRLSMDPSIESDMPDFSVITSVVFELGPRGRKCRPAVGQGTVDIGNIFLMPGSE
jgi:transcriptional regulator with XRE-family HTH domain